MCVHSMAIIINNLLSFDIVVALAPLNSISPPPPHHHSIIELEQAIIII